ncbi:MAG: DoxX family membrane protein [Candidatus Omnitrophica bacterium]|nr:DoxX family membrane protein [Candidatus Omnitrophota bacterium]
MKAINVYILIRVFIGGLFIVSGFNKIVNPVENFQYIVETYDIFPDVLEVVIARVVPWLELVFGIFCVLGLWLTWSLRGIFCLFVGFIIILSQAIVRKLPIDECGCFGEGLSFPMPVMLLIDTTMLTLTFLMIRNMQRTRQLSLDNVLDEKQ